MAGSTALFVTPWCACDGINLCGRDTTTFPLLFNTLLSPHFFLCLVPVLQSIPRMYCTCVCTDLQSGTVTQLATGHDFFSSPALSPDGSQLAYVAWDHPNMPWADTWLYVADVGEYGQPTNTR